MALYKFVATHPLWFVDYIMIDETLLDGAWESASTLAQKAKKGDKQFVSDRFVEEAKKNSQSEERSCLSKQSCEE